MTRHDILDNLTASQRQAVTHLTGPMLVVAGAGSGKTRVVTRRIAYLIDQGVRPDQILAMTFTNKAANEMRQRVESLVGQSPRWMGTFHSACARMLRFDLPRLDDGRTGEFTIYDEHDQQTLVKRAIEKLFGKVDRSEKRYQPRSLLAQISQAKCNLIAPENYTDDDGFSRIVQPVYEEYELQLRQANAVDFDDLLVLVVRLLEKCPDIADAYRHRFTHLLIDEYQDTNHAQYRLMTLLANADRNIHVTGDPDQSIYAWRGADYRNIMDFQNDFAGAKVVLLEQNYRSTQTVLHVANALIAHNDHRIDKTLFSDNVVGEPVTVACLGDESDEATWVVSQIEELSQQGFDPRDMAVLYRTNAQSRAIEEAMIQQTLPYQIVGGVRFYDRKEIKDLLAHLKVRTNPRDIVSLSRVTSCRSTGIGPKTLNELSALAERLQMPILTMLARDDFARLYGRRLGKRLALFTRWCRELLAIPTTPVAACVEKILVHSELREHYENHADRDGNVDDRIENLRALVNRAAEFDLANPDATLDAFLEDVALVADIDSWNTETRSVTLMTLHSAKGLEFPVVFIVGLEEQLLPHSNAIAKNDIDEERRLFYVGITRAEKRLFISHAARRFMWGKTSSGQPSRFLRELPTDHIHRIGIRLDEENEADNRRKFLAIHDAYDCDEDDPPFDDDDDNDESDDIDTDDLHDHRADKHDDAADDTSLSDADAATRDFLAAHKPTDATNPAADRIDKYVRGTLKAFDKTRPHASAKSFKKFIDDALSPKKAKASSSMKKKPASPAKPTHKKRPAADADEYGVNQLPPDWDD